MTNNLKTFLDTNKVETIATMMRFKKNLSYKLEIEELTDFLNIGEQPAKISERVYCLLNNITHKIKCEICESFATFKTAGVGYSKTCSRKCRYKLQSTKIQNTMQSRYGQKHALQIQKFKEKSKQTCLSNHGVENIFEDVTYIKGKTMDKLGVENIFKNNNYIRLKFKEKYGVDHPSKVEKFVEKSKQTCLEKYGVEFSIQSKNNKIKSINTKLLLYGNIHYNNPTKFKQTMQERYGVDNPLQLKEIREKIKHTCLEKYGVVHPSQNIEIHEKQQRFRWKNYIMPSGKIVKIQGYEDRALDELLLTYEEDEIVIQRKDIPHFNYIFENKNKVYFPDIYIPKENRIIEVKSTYTYEMDLVKNLSKAQSVKDNGYAFDFMIYSK